MGAYNVYLHLDLVEVVPARGEQRRLIMSFVRWLADNPNTVGDFTDRDESLRTRQIKIIGRYAVTYWVDDPVKAVMIVDVQVADR
jgi:mRNA-degrading endonuclease RelE of RelBE toxin-antitoxin system